MAFIAHPSVRIKGTEHNYNPVVCQEENCSSRDKGAHMHCPLCTLAEAYQDPVILRAHFRTKHLDKGIEFGGLKVLRCCNHCEIVGTIKGEKRFKGAHWHCYRCQNGFNRRDEAIKHFKTHFRNPHTTFQIQVTQEVNCRQYYDHSAEAHPKAYGGPAVCTGSDLDGGALSTILAQPCLSADTETLHTVEPKISYVSHELCSVNNFLVASEDEVDPSQHSLDRTQTLVLMESGSQAENLIYEEAASIIDEQSGEGLEQAMQMEKQVLELQQQNEALRLEKHVMEKKLRTEINRLKDQVSTVVQANLKLSEELKQYRSVEVCRQRVKQLVESLEEQHRKLIQAQLATLTRELLSQAEAVPMNGHMEGVEHSVSLKKVASNELEGTGTVVEVQVDCKSESLVAVPDCVGVPPGQEELAIGMDNLESAAVIVQTTIAPYQIEEDLSRKRRPTDEPGGEGDSKLQRAS